MIINVLIQIIFMYMILSVALANIGVSPDDYLVLRLICTRRTLHRYVEYTGCRTTISKIIILIIIIANLRHLYAYTYIMSMNSGYLYMYMFVYACTYLYVLHQSRIMGAVYKIVLSTFRNS